MIRSNAKLQKEDTLKLIELTDQADILTKQFKCILPKSDNMKIGIAYMRASLSMS